MPSEEILRRVDEERDFVAIGHHQHSLKKLRERYPEGAPAHVVARALGRTEAQVRSMYAVAVRTLRKIMDLRRGE